MSTTRGETYVDELYISVSSLRLLADCPRAWCYRYLLGLEPEDKSARMVLGAACHEALAHFYRTIMQDGSEPDHHRLLEVAVGHIYAAANGKVPILFADGEKIDDLVREAARLLRAFIATPYRADKILAVEERFAIDVVHPATGETMPFDEKIVGFWDLVVEQSGVIAVIDHKFRKRIERTTTADLQMSVYGLAASTRFGGTAIVAHQSIMSTKVPYLEIQPLRLGEHEKVEAIEAVLSGLELVHTVINHGNALRLLGRRRSWRCGTCPYRRRCDAERG